MVVVACKDAVEPYHPLSQAQKCFALVATSIAAKYKPHVADLRLPFEPVVQAAKVRSTVLCKQFKKVLYEPTLKPAFDHFTRWLMPNDRIPSGPVESWIANPMKAGVPQFAVLGSVGALRVPGNGQRRRSPPEILRKMKLGTSIDQIKNAR